MTKAEIVSEISRSTDIDKAVVMETVEKFMKVVKDYLANGENAYLRGFGSLMMKKPKPRLLTIYQKIPLSSFQLTISCLSSPLLPSKTK